MYISKVYRASGSLVLRPLPAPTRALDLFFTRFGFILECDCEIFHPSICISGDILAMYVVPVEWGVKEYAGDVRNRAQVDVVLDFARKIVGRKNSEGLKFKIKSLP